MKHYQQFKGIDYIIIQTELGEGAMLYYLNLTEKYYDSFEKAVKAAQRYINKQLINE